ncbi:DUF1236 domain-containing protein [Bradyrhizobium sp. AUGA SZCCT0158]|uniref:DUF1236 domain-containing protein n=1 Tax=Bradyrhizobium sp. AUGA SZCCT0158 TaxID=2807661 RepID=UPI0020116C4E|nr:DUF1236 domain-containing protein [Bradyrhizobium sp. AUGA SZCCT0158]
MNSMNACSSRRDFGGAQPHGQASLPVSPKRSDREQVATAAVLQLVAFSGWRKSMRKLILAAAAVALLSTGATAQTTVTTGASRAAVQIEPEARTRIKSYVTKHKLRPVAVKERIAVGATVPNDVELVAVPSDWGPSLTKYRYVYSSNRVLLVDPGSRAVVQEID